MLLIYNDDNHFGDFAFKFPAFGAPLYVKHELVSARTELRRGTDFDGQNSRAT